MTPLTRRGSVRMMGTSDARSKGNTGMLARICGLVAMLALVVAPACAPLCAARNCSQVSASTTAERPCHLAELMHGGESQFRTVQNCGTSELPAAILTSSIKNDASQASRALTFEFAFGTSSQKFFGFHSQPSERDVAGPPSPHLPATSRLDQILRI